MGDALLSNKSCATCGFLSRRPAQANSASSFFEMPAASRRNGGGWWALQVAGMGTQTVPACCVGAFPILDEIRAICPDALVWKKLVLGEEADHRSDQATPERTAAAKEVFNKPRDDCPEWFKYIPGLNPEKHLELRHMQLLEESRREWEQRLERERQEYDGRAEERQRKWELELFRKGQEAQSKLAWAGFWVAVAALIFTMGQVITGYAALTPDSVGWNWFPWLGSPTSQATPLPSLTVDTAGSLSGVGQ